MKWIKKAGLYALAGLASVMVLGSMTGMLLGSLGSVMEGDGFKVSFNLGLILNPATWLTGVVETALIVLLFLLFGSSTARASKRMLKSKAQRIEGALENSRFMNDKEKDELFPHKRFTKLN